MPDHGLFGFSGGWNTTKPPILLQENELERADNVRLLVGGALQKRGGTQRHGNDDSNTSPITGLASWRTPTGTIHNVRTKNAKIEYNNAGTWTDITGGLTVTTTTDVKHVFTVFRGNLLGTNGTNIPWKWPGTGNAAVITQAIGGGADTIDKAAAVCTHRERVVLGDVTATETAVQTRYESVIWPSDAGTLDTWSASPTGKIHIGQGDGDSITCLLSVLGYLVVFKHHSMWRVSDHGSSTQVVTRVANVGTASKHGAVAYMGRVYFQTVSGACFVYDPRQGDSPDAIREISNGKMALIFAVNDTFRSHVVALPRFNEIAFFVQDAAVSLSPSAENCAWIYNVTLDAWSRHVWDQEINFAANYIQATSERIELYLGTYNGFVRLGDVQNVLTDDSNGTPVAITATVYMAPTSCGEPGKKKWWKWAYLYTNSQGNNGHSGDATTITLYHDEALPATGTISTTHSLTMPDQDGASGDSMDSVAEARLTGFGKFTRFRLVHSAEDRIRISGLMLNYELTANERR